MREEFLFRDSNVFDNLAKEVRRNVASLMNGHRRYATIVVSELLMRAALANLDETKFVENGNDLTWLQDRQLAHTKLPDFH